MTVNGTTSDVKEDKHWKQIFWEAFNIADPESYVTLVDCHF